MQKRTPFYVVSLFLIAAFMTAGCATKDVVKKDEGIAAPPVATRVEPPKPEQPKVIEKQPEQTAAPQLTPIPETARLEPKSMSNEQLQSALATVYFDFDSAGLSDSSRGTLTKNAELLKKESSAKIRIEGNCDERGSSEYNLALGERRTKVVHQYLVTMGVEAARLTTVSYGNEKPAVQGSSEAAWAKNRRAEFAVVSP